MVSCIGSDMGKAAIAGHDCVTNQQINCIVVESGDDPLFVYYNLSTRKEEIRAAAGGSAVPILNKFAFGQIEILLPPLKEQRAIAYILGKLDDKIELNRRLNETLETMVRSVFKSWFVDFDPVRAKADGHTPELPEPIADLFPECFETSKIGEIPKGWEAKRLDQVLTAKDDRVGEGDVPEYSSTNNGLQLRAHLFKKQLSTSKSKNKLIQQGDLVFGLSRQVLNFGLMRDPFGCVSSAYKIFAVDRNVVVPDFLERLMRIHSSYFYNAISSSSREGQSISSDGLGLLRFVQPGMAVQKAFYSVTEPLLSRAKNAESESRTLADLRDALLPKLISGDLRLKNAERIIGRHI